MSYFVHHKTTIWSYFTQTEEDNHWNINRYLINFSGCSWDCGLTYILTSMRDFLFESGCDSWKYTVLSSIFLCFSFCHIILCWWNVNSFAKRKWDKWSFDVDLLWMWRVISVVEQKTEFSSIPYPARQHSRYSIRI